MKIIALLLSLTLLVVTHELGHFTMARIFGVRVRQFFMFFDWGFALLRVKKFDGKLHFSFFSRKTPEEWEQKEPEHTVWGIGWAPLGGYCDIAGMIDETKAAKDLESTPQPWEYRTKPAWQRLCIISGGVVVNFISALLIFSCIFAHWGKDELPMRNATLGYDYHQILIEHGLQNGDIIYSVNGKEVNDLAKVSESLLLDKARTVTVKRTYFADSLTGSDSSAMVTIDLGKNFTTDVLKEQPQQLLAVRMPMVVSDFVAGSAAEKAGMQVNDSIVSIAGVRTPSFTEISEQLTLHKGDTIEVGYYRPDKDSVKHLQFARVSLNNDAKLGVFFKQPIEVFNVVHTDYTFLQAVPAGISYGWQMLTSYVSSLKLLFQKGGMQNLGGFGTLGSLFPQSWDWYRFWNITAFLAIILAFMNIIPIPGLDGGHILFTLWEIITRRKPSDRFLEVAQTIGMAFLLLLLVVANGNDLLRWLRNIF